MFDLLLFVLSLGLVIAIVKLWFEQAPCFSTRFAVTAYLWFLLLVFVFVMFTRWRFYL